MRRFSVLLSVIAVVLLGIVALGAQPRVFAQEATPAADESTEEGLTYEPVAFATGVEVASPADLAVFRIGFDPGAGFPLEASDSSSGILVVESGAITVQIDAPFSVSRTGSLASAMATAEATGVYEPGAEEIASGQEVTLEAGDTAYIPANVEGEMRNDSDEPAMALAFVIGPPEDMMAEATPAP